MCHSILRKRGSLYSYESYKYAASGGDGVSGLVILHIYS